ncbi:sulfurtransferase-like selenium metabolism protein YedF [Aminipila terrae]|uniref:Sulfurtransferase-like selenium metabolism protein YedF n=1 Tax=Aminipila terrae TaxID=2697030 RepID=A0A6P1MFB2_9FIRM|nr:sulfurtransferase-like selenium metabolism protein YedF [Aminipila terrae]QHI73380.1 sulfurtransferase-like selenium metabolism protein YedF [Aminipila terrae]
MRKKQINAVGLTCPQPVIQTKNALESMENCGLLEVLVDNDIAVKNVMKFANSRNLKASCQKQNEHQYSIQILVSEKEKPQDSAANGECAITYENSLNNIVVLSSSKMGEGDSELGNVLMKGFIFALTQLEKLPETVIMYNGGAKLAIENSPCLEDLKTLEKLNVEILICGTCLKHYGIEDSLAVGNVTNMYTIAEKMMNAGSIIKP